MTPPFQEEDPAPEEGEGDGELKSTRFACEACGYSWWEEVEEGEDAAACPLCGSTDIRIA
jgi:rubrerythrin